MLPSPSDLNRLDVDAIVRDASRKQAFVTPMFEHVASRYDDFTRLFSFGMDRHWKESLVAQVRARQIRGEVVDLACGTGDLALRIKGSIPHVSVLGIDAATRMIEIAQARAAAIPHVRFEVRDLSSTGLSDGSVDAITAGYAFRNVASVRAALSESARILRPGGVLATLDFYRPEMALWRNAFLWYLRQAGNLVGWWWHRAPVMYGYIAASIDAWVSIHRFEDLLAAHGFDVLCRESHLGGGVAIHLARKR